jgi:hypothetical protein
MNSLLIGAIAAIAAIVVLIVIVLILSRSQGDTDTRHLAAGWQELARRLSLKYYPPPERSSEGASVRGHYQGYPITLRLRQRTAIGRDNQTIIPYTRIEVGIKNQARIYARLYKKGAFKHTDRAFGVPNVTFGSAELDNRFDVKSNPAEFVPRAISNRRQLYQQLLAVRTEHNVGIEIEGETLVFEQQGIETSPDYLQTIMDLLIEFAQAVEQGQ